jgi:hypothetical protein
MRKTEISRDDIYETLIELKSSLEDHIKSFNAHTAVFKQHTLDDAEHFNKGDALIEEIGSNIKEIKEIISALSYGKSFILGLSIFIGSGVGIVMGLKQIISWLRL